MTPDPLVEALARTIHRHQLGCNQLGCNQPAEPPAWMVAAAQDIADVVAGYANAYVYNSISRDLTKPILSGNGGPPRSPSSPSCPSRRAGMS